MYIAAPAYFTCTNPMIAASLLASVSTCRAEIKSLRTPHRTNITGDKSQGERYLVIGFVMLSLRSTDYFFGSFHSRTSFFFSARCRAPGPLLTRPRPSFPPPCVASTQQRSSGPDFGPDSPLWCECHPGFPAGTFRAGCARIACKASETMLH